MKLMKKLMLGAVATLAMTAAQASVIDVGGVRWDPDYGLDFRASSVSIRQNINPFTGEVSGYGIFTAMNGTTNFCPGCQVTFQFSGFMPIGAVLLPGAVGTFINYGGGDISMYVNHGPTTISNPSDVLQLNATNTNVGALWLGLSGHAKSNLDPTTLKGSVTDEGLEGRGFYDVKAGIAGGLARGNFDTNAMMDTSGNPTGADMKSTLTFGAFLAVGWDHDNNPVTPDLVPVDHDANNATPNKFVWDHDNNPLTASLTADSNVYLRSAGDGSILGQSIPEPGSLALVGLGLLGAAMVRRRKSA